VPKKHIIIFGVLCIVALGLGYWSGPFKKDSGQRAEVVAPTIVTNVVTNVLKEVVTNIVTATPQPTPTPTPPNIVTANAMNPIVEKEIRRRLSKPTGNVLTKADLEKVTRLALQSKKLTEVPKGLEKITQLKHLFLYENKLTDVKGLEKLTQLRHLSLFDNPDLTKAQIAELQKALPKCRIYWPSGDLFQSNPTK
jgi:hypothetical protein